MLLEETEGPYYKGLFTILEMLVSPAKMGGNFR